MSSGTSIPKANQQRCNAIFTFNTIKTAVSGFLPQKSNSEHTRSSDEQQLNNPTSKIPKNRFLEAASRVYDSPHYAASASQEAPYGYFRGRHIIGDCTKFAGGIYIGHQPQDAVVIDQRYGILDQVYDDLIHKLGACSLITQQLEYQVVNNTTEFVREILPIDYQAIAAFHERERIKADDKISLDVYLSQGIGLCHHQVLLAGYLLERLAEDKKIPGVASIDSTLCSWSNSDEVLLYTSISGCVLRFCPTEERIGEIVH